MAQFNSMRKNINQESLITIPGPEGLLEGKICFSNQENAPIALIFHPHPLHGGTMNNKIANILTQSFQNMHFNTLRINFRGIGNSQGKSVGGEEELEDALAALDWFNKKCETSNTECHKIWVSGFSFGAWVALQAAMRRPEITNFISVCSPVEKYKFNMLTPCPDGLIIQSKNDHVVKCEDAQIFASQLIRQKGCEVSFTELEDDHYFSHDPENLYNTITCYIEKMVA